ncbi:MAG TPA: ATP-binding protein, partial [Allosphingosinicella sp.]
ETVDRAAKLTGQLLAFARRQALAPETFDAAERVRRICDMVKTIAGPRIELDMDTECEGCFVNADAGQFETAIVNLAVNARDAMDGEGQLAIAVENVALAAGEVGELGAGDFVRISVSDTGSGMPPEVLERVFEPFFTTKPVGKGTGLGLSQIFGFARESGGDVVIHSIVGTGSTVSLYLPRSNQQVESSAAAAPGLGEAAHGPAGTAILVVEDDPRVSRSTVGALEELGYRPIACAGGREALEILEREAGRIELVITDIMMPEMTGPELVREATARWPSTAILYVTGYVGEAGSEELSGHDILRKPFTVAALAGAVAGALSKRPNEWPPASAAAAAAR